MRPRRRFTQVACTTLLAQARQLAEIDTRLELIFCWRLKCCSLENIATAGDVSPILILSKNEHVVDDIPAVLLRRTLPRSTTHVDESGQGLLHFYKPSSPHMTPERRLLGTAARQDTGKPICFMTRGFDLPQLARSGEVPQAARGLPPPGPSGTGFYLTDGGDSPQIITIALLPGLVADGGVILTSASGFAPRLTIGGKLSREDDELF